MSLYLHCNGASILGGNLQLYPLSKGELSLISASDFHRSCGWPIPPEVIVFGDDGQGDLFGVWLDREGIGRPLIVEIGEIFEEGCMAVTGTSLRGFLWGLSAFHALSFGGPDEALRSLGIPKGFMGKFGGSLDDRDYEELMRWSNPDLPNLPLSPYKARLTAEDVRRLSRMSV